MFFTTAAKRLATFVTLPFTICGAAQSVAATDAPLKAVSVRFLKADQAELEYRTSFPASETSTTFTIPVASEHVPALLDTADFQLGTVSSDGVFEPNVDQQIVGWSATPFANQTVSIDITVRRKSAANSDSILQLKFHAAGASIKSDFLIRTSPFTTDNAVAARMLLVNNTRSDWGGRSPDDTFTVGGFGFPKDFVPLELPLTAAKGGSGQVVEFAPVNLKETLTVKSADVKTDASLHPTLSIILNKDGWPKEFTQSGAINLRRLDVADVTATATSAKAFQKTAVEIGVVKQISVTRSKAVLGNIRLVNGKLEGFERRTTAFSSVDGPPKTDLTYVTETGWGFGDPDQLREPAKEVKSKETIPLESDSAVVKLEKKKAAPFDLHLVNSESSALISQIKARQKKVKSARASQDLLGDSDDDAKAQVEYLQAVSNALDNVYEEVTAAVASQTKIDKDIRSALDEAFQNIRSLSAQQKLDRTLFRLRQDRQLIDLKIATSVNNYHRALNAIGSSPRAVSANVVAGPLLPLPLLGIDDNEDDQPFPDNGAASDSRVFEAGLKIIEHDATLPAN